MSLVPAARIARIAWRTLWEKAPKTSVHKVVLREKETDQVVVVAPHQTLTLTIDRDSMVHRTSTWLISCE